MAYNIKNVKIPFYPSIYEKVYELQKIFLGRVFWLKYIFRIKIKIPILDLMLLPKTVFHLSSFRIHCIGAGAYLSYYLR